MTVAPQKTPARAAQPQPVPAAAPVCCQVPFASVQQQSLRLSSPGDPAEREAESTASRVTQMGPVAEAGAGQARASPGGGSGAPLPPPVRNFMEPRFGADFGAVRIHTDDRAAGVARQLNAEAVTVGGDVFFGRDRFQPETGPGRHLIAHELTHTIQQGAAVQRPGEAVVHRRESGVVQRFGIGDALDYFADKANLIPGFRMFTIILGVNPVNMSPVQRTAGNIMRAVIEFIPGGALITQAMDNYGVFDRVSAWVDQQIRTLGMTGSVIKRAVTEFLDSLSWRDIFHLGDVWQRAKRIFSEPIDRILSFLGGLVIGILKLIKDAILRPLAKLAEGTKGYDLLRAVLGEDPVTGDPYPRTAETLIGGFMKLIGQEEIWENVKKANAIARAWAWFQGALAGLMGFVRRIPGLFVQALQSLELMDIVLLPRAFAKVVGVFGSFVLEFIAWAGRAVWELLEIIFAVVAPGVLGYLKKAAGAFRTILKNPIGFVGNLVRAAKLGFQQFAGNIGKHLKTGLINWLTGSLAGANIYIPQSFELGELVKFVLSVLGLTWPNIRAKLVKATNEITVKALETGFDIVVTLVRDGPAAAWAKISEYLTNLKDIVIEEITKFVTSKIVEIAITKLISFLNPAGAIIQAIIAIYNTIMFFVERLKQIAQVVAAFIDSIAAIAGGVIVAAANKVETTLAGLLSLAISFLARLVGLGKVSDAITGVINRIRAPIDKALDKVVEWIVKGAGKVIGGLKSAAGKVLAWWKQKTSFKAGGESHELSFSGEAASAVLMIASGDPTSLKSFLEKKQSEANISSDKKDAIRRINDQLVIVNGLIVAAAGKEGDDTSQKAIQTAMNLMAEHLIILLSSTEWGTEDNPVPLAYQKRRADAYPVFYLAVDTNPPKASQSDLQVQFNNPAYKDRIVRCAPTSETKIPNEKYIFGLGAKSQIDVGRRLRFKEEGERKSEVGNFKEATKRHGFIPSEYKFDVDHVVELQIGGQDEASNLWPLPLGENRSGGALLKDAKITPKGLKELQIKEALEQKKLEASQQKKGLKEELWMIVTSTYQR